METEILRSMIQEEDDFAVGEIDGVPFKLLWSLLIPSSAKYLRHLLEVIDWPVRVRAKIQDLINKKEEGN